LAHEFDTPFDNIESAQEYLALLSRELDVAKQEIWLSSCHEFVLALPCVPSIENVFRDPVRSHAFFSKLPLK